MALVKKGPFFMAFYGHKISIIIVITFITTSNIGVSFISLHDTPRPHTLNRVIRNLMRLAHI